MLRLLGTCGYTFVTTTPASHARVIERPGREVARNLTDVLGWSLPFAPETIPEPVFILLNQAGVLAVVENGLHVATIRVSRVRGALFLHSAYPTTGRDSVFLGPDSYRFADLIVARKGELPSHARVLDYGAGAGVGGISAVAGRRDAKLTLADVNPRALFLASINAECAGLDYSTVKAGRPSDIHDKFDLIVTHPPFMMDEEQRAYRDGGDLFGGQLALDWVCEGMTMLRAGGRLIVHTGASIVDGKDVLLDALRGRLPAIGMTVDYHELDPDIFGDELDKPAYVEVDRNAAVGLVLTRLDDSAGDRHITRALLGSRSPPFFPCEPTRLQFATPVSSLP